MEAQVRQASSCSAYGMFLNRRLSDLWRCRCAHAYIDLRGAPIVIKADGLAACRQGGGFVAMSLEGRMPRSI